jgi:hypothetical protein
MTSGGFQPMESNGMSSPAGMHANANMAWRGISRVFISFFFAFRLADCPLHA